MGSWNKDIINQNILWMHATGLMNAHYNNQDSNDVKGFFTPKKMNLSCERVASTRDSNKLCRSPKVFHVSIGLKHFSKLFSFYFLGNTIASLSFIIEIFLTKIQNK